MKQIIITLVIFISFLSVSAQQEESNGIQKELKAISSMLNDLYNIGYCNDFIVPPFYACCNGEQRMSAEDHMACCEESNIPSEYRIHCRSCINIGELDTLTLVVEMIDTLFPMNFVDHQDYIMEKVDTGSTFYPMVSKARYGKKKKGFDVNELNQKIELIAIKYKDDDKKEEEEKYTTDTIAPKEITFISRAEKKKQKKRKHFGKHQGQLMLGSMAFSRVYFNDSHTKCFYYFGYLGGNSCGYTDIILAEKREKSWHIVQRIGLGDF